MKKLAWAAAALLACGLLATPATAQQRTRPERNRIRAEEISASTATTVYQLIQRSRGMWLMRNHPTDSGAGAMLVFYDGAQLESVEDLRDIPLSGVQLIEFLTPAESEHRLGKYTTVGTIRVMSHDDTTPPPSDSARAHPR